MKVSVIFEDGTIVKDNVPLIGLDLGEYDTNFHALQWNGMTGYIETKRGDNIWLEGAEGEAVVAPYLAKYAAEVEKQSNGNM